MICWQPRKSPLILRLLAADFILMYSFLKKTHRYLFFGAWLLINLIQACTTELFDDEAYYWVYSQYLAWGYFDHPPMIAVLIKAGYEIFQSELGLRLFVVLLNTATIYLISKLIEGRNDKLFYAISLSVAVGHIGGIIAVPDVPLLFFVALFFLAYKRFIQNTNFVNSVLLALSIALMVYTKYHGFLVVLFTLLSNIRLLSNPKTYLVAALSIAFFTPHLYWQYLHGFPSVKYHLFERNARSYELEYTSEYIVAQLLFAGPFIGWLLIWSAIRYKALTGTERALRFTLLGFYLFFLVSTIKGRVEANWTLPAFVALIVLSHQYLKNVPRLTNWVYRSLSLTLLFMIAARIYMMLDIENQARFGKDEFHQNREWVGAILNKANGLPVVFVDSYQRPSKYWFYAQEPALGMNGAEYRRTNFNFWPFEESYFGKKVLVVGDYDSVCFNDKIIAPKLINKGAAIVPFYFSFMKAELTRITTSSRGKVISTSFDVTVPTEYLAYFRQSPYDSASVNLAVMNVNDSVRYYSSSLKVKQIANANSSMHAEFIVPLPKGSYTARLGISTAIPGEPSLNSTNFRIKIE